MSSARFVSVVVPVKDEAQSLPELADQLLRVLPSVAGRFEVVFVDDGSTDGSTEELRRLVAAHKEFSLHECRKNFGKSMALDVGFRAVQGDVVVTLDSDLQDDPAEIPAMIAKLDEGWDMVVGWKKDRKDPWHKTLPSKFFNWTTGRVSHLRLHDFNCGLKVLRREVVDSLSVYGEQHRYIPAIAHWRGFRVTEVPVRHHPRKFGRSKFGIERYLRGFFDLLTVAFIAKYGGRPMHFFGRLGLILIVAGLAILGHLSLLKLRGAFIAFRPLLTLGVLLLTIGFLFLSTGLLGEMILHLFRMSERDVPGYVVRRKSSGGEPEAR